MLCKCCTQYANKFGKLSSGHGTGKGQFAFQSQRKTMPNKAQTAAQLHSSHTLAKQSSKFSKPCFNSNVNREIPDVQAGFRKGRGIRHQIANICWMIEKARQFQKNISSALLTMPKPLTVDYNRLWKILQGMGIPDHLTGEKSVRLLRNLYAGQEATVRTGHGTTDWFQIGKGCILSPCLFNLHAEYIMRNTGLDGAQARIKIAGTNINSLRYAGDTFLRQKVKRN